MFPQAVKESPYLRERRDSWRAGKSGGGQSCEAVDQLHQPSGVLQEARGCKGQLQGLLHLQQPSARGTERGRGGGTQKSHRHQHHPQRRQTAAADFADNAAVVTRVRQ